MTLNGVMALFCVISANSGSLRAHCVKVYVRYLISWWVLVLYTPTLWTYAPNLKSLVLLIAKIYRYLEKVSL